MIAKKLLVFDNEQHQRALLAAIYNRYFLIFDYIVTLRTQVAIFYIE